MIDLIIQAGGVNGRGRGRQEEQPAEDEHNDDFARRVDGVDRVIADVRVEVRVTALLLQLIAFEMFYLLSDESALYHSPAGSFLYQRIPDPV